MSVGLIEILIYILSSLLLIITSKSGSSLLLVSIVNLVEKFIELRISNNKFVLILVLSKGIWQSSRNLHRFCKTN